MNKKILWVAVIILIAAVAAWAYTNKPGQKDAPDQGSLVAKVTYTCDKGKTITAAYYDGPAAPKQVPGEPPVPGGSAKVSIDGGPEMTLMHTISADGTRYATADESLVFWSRGTSAFIMRNSSVDQDYNNCEALAIN